MDNSNTQTIATINMYHVEAREWELGVVGLVGLERVGCREDDLDIAALHDVARGLVIARALVRLADQVEAEPPLEALGRVGRVAAVELDVVELLDVEPVAHGVVAHKVLVAHELDALAGRRRLLGALGALSVRGRHVNELLVVLAWGTDRNRE